MSAERLDPIQDLQEFVHDHGSGAPDDLPIYIKTGDVIKLDAGGNDDLGLLPGIWVCKGGKRQWEDFVDFLFLSDHDRDLP
jgi:hypothetical protein